MPQILLFHHWKANQLNNVLQSHAVLRVAGARLNSELHDDKLQSYLTLKILLVQMFPNYVPGFFECYYCVLSYICHSLQSSSSFAVNDA